MFGFIHLPDFFDFYDFIYLHSKTCNELGILLESNKRQVPNIVLIIPHKIHEVWDS